MKEEVMKKLLGLTVATASLALASNVSAQTDALSFCGQGTVSQIIYFEFNQSQSAETLSQIQRVKEIVDACDVQSISLVGHTDTSGSASYNQALSVKRADRVASALVNAGVSRGLISTSGMGETQPFVPTADGVKEQLNRRVESVITIIPEVVEYVPEPEPIVEYVPEPEPIVEYVPEPEPVVEYVPEPEPVIEPAPEPVVEPAPVAVDSSGNLLPYILGAAAIAATAIALDDDTVSP